MLSPAVQIVFAIILGAIIVIGCLAYILVVWVTYRDKNLRQNIASIFLFNLLAIDFANLLLVMPFSLTAMDGNWQLGHGWKMVNAFVGTSLELASVLALAVISLDRLAAVMKPFVYRAQMTKNKATYLTLFTWFQAIIFSMLPVPFKWYVFNNRYMSCTFNSRNDTVPFYIYMVFFMVCNFLVSLIIIVGTYLYIFRVARAHRKRIAVAIIPRIIFNMQTKPNIEGSRQREIRTACKILVVIGAFVVCHLPYASMRILELSHFPIDNVSAGLTVAAKWMSFSKSALDPFIYFLLQKKFRRSFNKLFQESILSNRSSGESKILRSRRRSTPVIDIKGTASTQIHPAVVQCPSLQTTTSI